MTMAVLEIFIVIIVTLNESNAITYTRYVYHYIVVWRTKTSIWIYLRSTILNEINWYYTKGEYSFIINAENSHQHTFNVILCIVTKFGIIC